MLIHQQHVSSEYKVRGGNGNVLITLETGVERDIRNYNMIDIKHHMHVIVWLAKSKIKFRNAKNKLVKKELLLCFIIKTASRPSKIRIVNKKNIFCYFVDREANWQYCDCVDPSNPCTSLSALTGYPCPHYLLDKY